MLECLSGVKMDHELIQRAAEDILHSNKTIAFTGAGISVESGSAGKIIPVIVEEVKKIRGLQS